MDPEIKALCSFMVILLAWVAIPVLPAWLTFRITPDQQLGLKGPFHGLTLKTGGAFSAYVVVMATVSMFVWQVGSGVIGQMMQNTAWTVSGPVAVFDVEGAEMTTLPNLSQTTVHMVPNPFVINDNGVNIPLPFRDYRQTVIYFDVPGWGGGSIKLSDPSAYKADPFTRQITLKSTVVLRQAPESASIGPSLVNTEN